MHLAGTQRKDDIHVDVMLGRAWLGVYQAHNVGQLYVTPWRGTLENNASHVWWGKESSTRYKVEISSKMKMIPEDDT